MQRLGLGYTVGFRRLDVMAKSMEDGYTASIKNSGAVKLILLDTLKADLQERKRLKLTLILKNRCIVFKPYDRQFLRTKTNA